jgi:hypothetical protein
MKGVDGLDDLAGVSLQDISQAPALIAETPFPVFKYRAP